MPRHSPHSPLRCRQNSCLAQSPAPQRFRPVKHVQMFTQHSPETWHLMQLQTSWKVHPLSQTNGTVSRLSPRSYPPIPNSLAFRLLMSLRNWTTVSHEPEHLGKIAFYLPIAILPHALEVGAAIEDERARADALQALIPVLSAVLLQRSLEAIATI